VKRGKVTKGRGGKFNTIREEGQILGGGGTGCAGKLPPFKHPEKTYGGKTLYRDQNSEKGAHCPGKTNILKGQMPARSE